MSAGRPPGNQHTCAPDSITYERGRGRAGRGQRAGPGAESRAGGRAQGLGQSAGPGAECAWLVGGSGQHTPAHSVVPGQTTHKV